MRRVLAGSVAQTWRFGRHYGAMPSIHIKDVPEETHAVLRQRSVAVGRSLQEYLRGRLIEEASVPTIEEILAAYDRVELAAVQAEAQRLYESPPVLAVVGPTISTRRLERALSG